MRRNPYPVYDRLRGGSPVFHFPPFDLWMIFDFEGVRRALVDHGTFSSDLSPAHGTGNPGAAHQDDLLTRLVEAEVDGERLTPQEILGFVQLLLVGGQETTANLINNAVLCFLEYPDQLARLRAEPDLLPSAIEEALRYRSPVHWMPRATRRAVQMHGQV